MDEAEHGITVIHRLGDDAQGHHVVDLIDGDVLALELLPDAVNALDTGLDLGLDLVFAQLLFDDGLDLREKGFAFLTARFNGIFDLVVSDGVDVLEGEVFEFAANFAHTETMGDGGVDFLRLARDLDLTLGA